MYDITTYLQLPRVKNIPTSVSSVMDWLSMKDYSTKVLEMSARYGTKLTQVGFGLWANFVGECDVLPMVWMWNKS